MPSFSLYCKEYPRKVQGILQVCWLSILPFIPFELRDGLGNTELIDISEHKTGDYIIHFAEIDMLSAQIKIGDGKAQY